MNINIVWKAKKKGDSYGYLRVSIRKNGATQLKSLGLDKIHSKHFNSKKQRVKTSFKEHEYYNAKIESKLKELSVNGNNLELLAFRRNSFLLFLEDLISRTQNRGTKDKYQNAYNMVSLYNSEVEGRIDLFFDQINQAFILGFMKWLRDVRKCTSNTTGFKMKSIKALVNKGVKQGLYNYPINPFEGIKLKFHDTKVSVLTTDELKKLCNTELKEAYRSKHRFGEIITTRKAMYDKRYKHRLSLDEYRNIFLFQLFASGIRVSDLMTLRWNNFYVSDSQLRVKKRQIKTKNPIDFIVNDYCLDILVKYTNVDNLFPKKSERILDIKNVINGLQEELELISNEPYFMIPHSEIPCSERLLNVFEKNELVVKSLSPISYGYIFNIKEVEGKIKKYNSKKRIENGGYSYVEQPLEENTNNSIQNKDVEMLLGIKNYLLAEMKHEKGKLNRRLKNYKAEKKNLIFDCILELNSKEDYKNRFCLPLLDYEAFKDIPDNNDFGRMTKKQYQRYAAVRMYYNKMLKIVGSQCGITKTMTSHLARHSYAYLVLEEHGESLNLFDLMVSLGHKHLTTTQSYLQRFTHKNIDKINLEMAKFLK